MDASNMFGRGFGENRIKLILDECPDIFLQFFKNTYAAGLPDRTFKVFS